MIVVIRISGLVETPVPVNETLSRMRLRRKYSAILMKDDVENRKLLKVVRNFVAYGPISNEMLVSLLEKRAQATNKKKVDAAKVALELEKKDLTELGIKPFFRLHPPRGGIDSKIHFPIKKGVLGDNQDKINNLLVRML